MKRRTLLLIDSIVNFILGALLLAYSGNLAEFFGVPVVESSFYPNILGGVFIGIALALFVEYYGNMPGETSGLGLLGAICINLCGGLVLLFWLLFGDMDIPVRGVIFLWCLDILLIVLSSVELFQHFRSER